MNKYKTITTPVDHTGRWYVTVEIFNPDFIGPLEEREFLSIELERILKEEIAIEIGKEQ